MDAQALHKRLERLKSDRNTLDAHCQEIAERILPRQAEFQGQVWTKGQKRTDKMFDETAALALQRGVAAFDSMLTPQGQTWHGLRASTPEVDKIPAVRRYFEEVTNILFRYRYSTKANFANQLHETYTSLMAFGTGFQLIEPRREGGIFYKSLPMACAWLAENAEGRVDTVFRTFKFTARQAYQKWGDALPDKIKNSVKDKPDEEHDFIHVVMPREDYEPGRLDARGKRYASVYLADCDKEKVLSIGGYNSFPIAVSRYVTAPSEQYGRSPAMTVLPAIKQLNEINKETTRVIHFMTRPSLLLGDDLGISTLNVKPGGVNPGTLGTDGVPRVKTLDMNLRPDMGMELMKQKREIINDAFLVTLFQILVDGNNRMTATEVIERAREKGALLAPTMSRQQNELLGPMIEREIEILTLQGLLPDMPMELLEAEGEYEIQYDSPLARAQRSEEALGFNRTLNQIIPLAQIDPNVMKLFDMEAAVRGLAQLNGMPERWIKDPERLAAEAEQEAMAMQAQQLLAAAPVVADTQKTMAEAQQIAMAGAAGRV